MQIKITDHSEDAYVQSDSYKVFNDAGVPQKWLCTRDV